MGIGDIHQGLGTGIKTIEHVPDPPIPALRHRILLNFEAQAENIPPDLVLQGILKEVKEADPTSAKT